MEELTAVELRAVLNYDHLTGTFTRTTGTLAGSQNANGYCQISIRGKLYQSHRLAWLHVNGCWPVGDIDHINGVKNDNRITNLRDVCHAVNCQNQSKPQRNSTTGFRGVNLNRGKYRAQLKWRGKVVHLGAFDTPQEAHAAYLKGRAEYV